MFHKKDCFVLEERKIVASLLNNNTFKHMRNSTKERKCTDNQNDNFMSDCLVQAFPAILIRLHRLKPFIIL